MKALSQALLGLLVFSLAFGVGHASQIRPEQSPDRFAAVSAPQETGPVNSWASAQTRAPSPNYRPVLQVAYDYGPLLEGYRHGSVNFYGYQPFGYLGYQSDAYKGYRAPGYYGYEYYYQYPVFDPGFRFRFRM